MVDANGMVRTALTSMIALTSVIEKWELRGLTVSSC